MVSCIEIGRAKHRRARWLAGAFAGLWCIPLAVSATLDEMDARAFEAWVTTVRRWAPDELAAYLDDFDPSLALELFRQVQAALHDPSVERLAALQPYIRVALMEARRMPRFSPWIAWLEARLDYFDEGRRVMEVRRALSTRRVPVAALPTESDRRVWRKRVERPAPPQARPMVPALKKVFARNGAPEALVWLAEIESGFNPAARSPAGAVGLYQLMPATARALGLRADAKGDDRLDPLKNADAASRYLVYLHRRFKGWPPALAAYNAGETRVARQLAEAGGDFNAALRRLPAETRMYVPRALETIRWREGVELD